MKTQNFAEFFWLSTPQLTAALDFYLQPGYRTVASSFRHYQQLCSNDGAPPVSRSTYYAHIVQLDPLEVIYRQEGYTAAKKTRREALERYEVRGLFSQYQADVLHAPIALRKNISLEVSTLPLIYNVLDVWSRCIMGHFVDFTSDGESANAAIECFKRAYLPKVGFSQRYGCEHEYRYFGPPSTVVNDGGVCYVAASTREFQLHSSVSILITETGAPWRNCFIESFNRTIATVFLQKLPGFLPPKRGNDYFRSLQKVATLTESEFEVLYARYVVDDYHHTPHSGLCGETPDAAYREATEKYLWVPSPMRNCDWIHTSGGVRDHGIIQAHKGIQDHGRMYNNGELQQLRHRLIGRDGKNPQVDYYYFPPPGDARVIKVIDPRSSGTSFLVPFTRTVQGKQAIDDDALVAQEFADEELQILSKLSSEEIVERAKERNRNLEKEAKARRKRARPEPLDPSSITTQLCRQVVTGQTRPSPLVSALSGVTPAASRQPPPTKTSDSIFSRDDFSGSI